MLKKNTQAGSCLWKIFYLLIFLVFLSLGAIALGFNLDINENQSFRLLFLAIPVVLLIAHSLISLVWQRAFLFIFLAASLGWIMEVYGLAAGTFFGGHYIYQLVEPMFFGVPISVILYWAVFIYTGYCISNAFLFWQGKEKPHRSRRNLKLLPGLIIMDAFFVLAIDLFMDPIQVELGAWQWLEGGVYFGVPIGNFVGWFTIAAGVSFIFRGFEYLASLKEKQYDKSINLIPVLGYGVLGIFFSIEAWRQDLKNLIPIGLILIMPTVIVNLIIFKRERKKL